MRLGGGGGGCAPRMGSAPAAGSDPQHILIDAGAGNPQQHCPVAASEPGRLPDSGSERPSNAWFIKCHVPQSIIQRKNNDRTGNYFWCDNHFNTGLTLTWAVQDDGNGGGFLTIPSGQSTLLTAGSSGCRSLTLSPGSRNRNNQPVIFKGATSTTAGLYVEIYFTAIVTVQNGNGGVGGGCP